jgi:predicted dehydrogenase
MTRQPLNRRQFLAINTAAGLGVLGAPALLKGASPNEKLNLAFIGVGGRGGANLASLALQSGKGGRNGVAGEPREDINVVALCDVNLQNLDRASKLFPKARTYRDFRKLYETTSDIDAVVVSTCEHTHAFATLPALQLGKHVYCEKPLTLNVQEARRVMEVAAGAKVATQMGTQIHGMPNYRRVVELIQSGAIGPVREAHVWVSRAWGLQSEEDAAANKDIVYVADRPQEVMTPPDHLDWDLWLGPAPFRPYHDVYFPGPKWYRWWDFGNGTMSDLGSHWNDLPFWALNLDAPLTIEASGPPPHPEIAPASMTARYEYGPRGDMPACSLTWYQGVDKPALWKDKGMLLSDYSKHVLLPEDKYQDFQRPEHFIPDSPGQHEEWLMACKTGSPTGSPFSYAGLLTEANHLGNVAYRAGKKLHWDSKACRVTNCSDADPFLGREPRSGWSLG